MIAIGLTHAAQSAGQTGGNAELWALVALGIGVLGMSLALWLLRGHHPPDDDSGWGGPGGPPPGPPSPPPEPVWWEDFERDFAAYAITVGPRPGREETNAP